MLGNPNIQLTSRTRAGSTVRWTIVALLFFATTINYIDRQVIGLLKPVIQNDLKWDELDYGYIITAFQISYAVGLVISGWLLDRFGTYVGYAWAITVWSVGALLHAVARSVLGFGVARSVLGLGEAANFPAAVKTVTEWFPKKDRALATGIFNSGSTVGAIIAPIIVAEITLRFGWKWAFICTGLLGFVWIVFWLAIYRTPSRHKRVSAAELQYILSDKPEGQETIPDKVSWNHLFRYKETYVICITRFLTDWVWWFFLFWTPDFLNTSQHIDLRAAVLPLIIIYALSSAGGIFGGALSSGFIKQGKTVDFSRKMAILICAVLVFPLALASYMTSLWVVVLIIGLAAAAHQGWAANIFTIVSDIYPMNAVGTMVGLSGFAGAIGGAFAASFIGWILEITKSYSLVFIIASTMYFLAWLCLKLFIPRIEEIDLK